MRKAIIAFGFAAVGTCLIAHAQSKNERFSSTGAFGELDAHIASVDNCTNGYLYVNAAQNASGPNIKAGLTSAYGWVAWYNACSSTYFYGSAYSSPVNFDLQGNAGTIPKTISASGVLTFTNYSNSATIQVPFVLSLTSGGLEYGSRDNRISEYAVGDGTFRINSHWNSQVAIASFGGSSISLPNLITTIDYASMGVHKSHEMQTTKQ